MPFMGQKVVDWEVAGVTRRFVTLHHKSGVRMTIVSSIHLLEHYVARFGGIEAEFFARDFDDAVVYAVKLAQKEGF